MGLGGQLAPVETLKRREQDGGLPEGTEGEDRPGDGEDNEELLALRRACECDRSAQDHSKGQSLSLQEGFEVIPTQQRAQEVGQKEDEAGNQQVGM